MSKQDKIKSELQSLFGDFLDKYELELQYDYWERTCIISGHFENGEYVEIDLFLDTIEDC